MSISKFITQIGNQEEEGIEEWCKQPLLSADLQKLNNLDERKPQAHFSSW